MKQLVELHSLIPAGRQKDNVIIAVSPDPLDKFKQVIPIVTAKTGKEFVITLLSDAQHKVIDLYGLRNEAAAARGTYIPYPTTFLIDGGGVVRWKFTEKNQAVRPANSVMLEQLRKLW